MIENTKNKITKGGSLGIPPFVILKVFSIIVIGYSRFSDVPLFLRFIKNRKNLETDRYIYDKLFWK